jgi:predicted methyltransferase
VGRTRKKHERFGERRVETKDPCLPADAVRYRGHAGGVAQTAPDYATIIAAPDRSDADRKLDTNRAPAQWLAFIGAKPGMKILDIFAVYGWKAELLARAVGPSGKVYAQNSEAVFARVKDRLDALCLVTPTT